MHYLRTLLMTWKTGFCLIKPLKARSLQACPFRKFHPVGIRAVRQNHRIIRVDAFEGAKLSHGETVSGKAKARPPQEGRHPRCRPRARAHPPSIRPSPPGTVQCCSGEHTYCFASVQPNHSMAVLKDGDRIIECRLGPEWNDQAKKLNKDDWVNMQGRISNNQKGSQLYLLDCEFTSDAR
jgi:hypothetical protein